MVQPPHVFEGLGLDGVRGVGPYGAVELLGVEDAEEERRREQEEKEREKERKRGRGGRRGRSWSGERGGLLSGMGGCICVSRGM
jgi:hypothetical protein